MTSDKLQYDSSLGGDIKLPTSINAGDFAAAHINEIKSLIHSINNPQNNKIIHQMMPNRMRRRAMTQNPKRLPRKYREIHVAQMSKSGVPTKNKRPSRKYRRRPSNLMKEYARRMRKNIWLETHIWHAKRFHVKELWGYKIPWTPCDRAGRAAYRAVAKHCLVQDISYYGCIEIEGPFSVLKEGFQKICSQECGLTLTANVFIRGNREGLNRAPKRMKALPALDTEFLMTGPPKDAPKSLSNSAIWDANVRKRILNEMLSTHEINTKRSKEVLVPGETSNFEFTLQPLPILVIQRPGNQDSEWKKIGFGSGYDVIIPNGYGLSVWLNLIAAGARACGVQEVISFHKEMGNDQFLPDTIPGQKEADRVQRELLINYFKRPPNRRVNYTKLSIAKPFKAPWKQLLQNWDNQTDNWHVLRDKDKLVRIQQAIKRRFNIQSAQLEPDMLIPVKLTMMTHGNPGEFSLICIPRRDDLRQNIRKLKLNDNHPVYIEPLKSDPHESERNKLKITHKKLLKRLRSRRVRKKRREQANSLKRIRIMKADTGEICAQHFKKMCQLWLPDNFPSIRHQCSRETIGYMTLTGFTLSEGRVTGIGYVAAKGLEKLLKAVNKGKLICLVRGTKTRNYRFASISLKVS
uniref:CSON001977 protein n=2 Tax=Culicoides sonorensis TaxID=179676 RepID=A0A336LRL9_CULSO